MDVFFARSQNERRDAREGQLVDIANRAGNRRIDGRDGRVDDRTTHEHRVSQKHVAGVRHQPCILDAQPEFARQTRQARAWTDFLDHDIRAAFGASFRPTRRVMEDRAVAEAHVAAECQVKRVDPHVERGHVARKQQRDRDGAGEVQSWRWAANDARV